MFKKLLPILVGLFVFLGAGNAQVNYTFSASSGTFTAISGTAVTYNFGTPPAANADDGYGTIPIGFPFSFNGTPVTNVGVCANGFMYFGAAIAGTSPDTWTNNIATGPAANTASRGLLAPLWDDMDNTAGSTQYAVSGASPNRVLTVQWLNQKWQYSATAAVISYQVKLYETTGVIEFVYRQEAGTPSNAGNGDFGATIGIAAATTGSGNFMSLNGPTAAPTVSTTTETTNITTKPATGQVYTFTPLLCPNPVINPTSAALCLGGVQQFTLAGSGTGTQTFTSTTPIVVPLGPATGAAAGSPAGPYPSTLNVSGLPVTGVTIKSVTLSGVTHTFPDDIDVVLVSPNGTQVIIMSDVGSLNGITNNTYVFDDNATATMADAAAIPSGTYKPSNFPAATVDNFPSPGPGGITQASPNPLLSAFNGVNMNGTWNLYVVDDLGGDVGSMTGFSIIFNTPPAPVTGTFSPATGLYTNPGATTPYIAGTQANTVYASPTAPSTTYTVTVVNGACTTSTNFTVTVANPPVFTKQPRDTSVCELGTTVFTVATASAATYQWQDSIPGGAWTDIAGATSATLTLTNVPLSFNGKYYRARASAAPCTNVASTRAKLTVNALPLISINAAPYTRLFPGLTTTLTATTSPAQTTGFTWYKNGSPVAGATGNTLVRNVDQQGIYTARATNALGCTSLLSNAVAIGDSASSNLFIYPTPNNGVFQVRYYSVPGNPLPRYLYIYDSKGSRVYVQQFIVGFSYEGMSVDMTRFKSGTYWVELADQSGKRIKIGRTQVL